MKTSRLQALFKKYLNSTATSEEELEFFSLLLKENPEEDLTEILQKMFEEHQAQTSFFTERESGRLLGHIKQRTGMRRKMFQFAWKYAAAVLLALCAGLFLYYYLAKRPMITEMKEKVVVRRDVAPGNEKAVITLADGKVMDVDLVANGTFDDHGNIFLKEENGLLNYAANHTKNKDVAFHTMTVPKGGQYQLVLADGTKVWLNSASSIRYPTSFNGKTREVSVDGEAYFEVAHDAEKPFFVKSRGQAIRVLGTHFNVKAYKDEPVIKTTLLEGSIELSTIQAIGKEAMKLLPGDEAEVTVRGAEKDVRLTHLANPSVRIAWTDGYFAFNRTDLESVLRELSRWYNVDFKVKTKTTKTYTGKIDRKLSLSELMNGLALSGISIQIEDNDNIIVLPN